MPMMTAALTSAGLKGTTLAVAGATATMASMFLAFVDYSKQQNQASTLAIKKAQEERMQASLAQASLNATKRQNYLLSGTYATEAKHKRDQIVSDMVAAGIDIYSGSAESILKKIDRQDRINQYRIIMEGRH